jgi:hypothetical protein
MRRIILLLAGLCGLTSIAAFATTNEAAVLTMPDGQLRSHSIRVFLDRDITTAMRPVLTLSINHALLLRGRPEYSTNACSLLARNQRFTEDLDGQETPTTGTIMLSNLDERFRIPFYKAAVQALPSLTWNEGGADNAGAEPQTAIGAHEIYLGNTIGAFIWTFVVMATLAVFIVALCAKIKGSAWVMVCAEDGTLSLWRAQLLAWTFVVGSVVLCFGLTRLEIPTIPETLVALMGMSLATGGLGYIGNKEHLQPKGASAGQAAPKTLPVRLGELLCDENGELSVARIQMVFWTVLMLLLFFVKSFQESAVWEVPWTMVTLMGFSQAGYIGPKFASPPSSATAAPAAPAPVIPRHDS